MKALIVVGVLVLVAGLIYGVAEAAKPGGNELKPTLFTLIGPVGIDPGDTKESDYISLEGFSDYNVIIRRSGPDDVGSLSWTLIPSIDEITPVEFINSGFPMNFVRTASVLSPADYLFTPSNEPYKFVKGVVEHTGTGGTQTVTMFLYAVP